MDQFDLFLDKLKEENIPSHYSSFINTTLESLPNKAIKHFNLFKGLSVAAGICIIISGGVYAGTKLYENIMHEPEEKHLDSYVVTEEEKEKFKISEEEAIEFGIKYVKEFIGIDIELNILPTKDDNDDVVDSKPIWLTREIAGYNDLYYMISYRDLNSTPYNAENYYLVEISEYGEFRSFVHQNAISYTQENMEKIGLTALEARNEAEIVFKKYLKDYHYEDYELTYFGWGSSLAGEEYERKDQYVTQWNATFVKSYNGLLDNHDSIQIGFTPTSMELELLNISNTSKYENNELVITKEQAIEIARNEDMSIEKDKPIKEIICDLRINTMNSNVYLRENYKKQFESREINNEAMYNLDENGQASNIVTFSTEERTRKTWQVCVIYDYDGDGIEAFTYYIDATTGEIIGGNLFNDFYYEEFSKNAENNYAYK